METDLIQNVSGNVQALRNIWNVKSQDETKILKPKALYLVMRSSPNF